MRFLQLVVTLAVAATVPMSTSVAATILWDGGGDTFSFYQEANWVVTENTDQPTWIVGNNPPAGTTDFNTAVPANMIIGGTAGAGGGDGVGGEVIIGDGLSLTVRDAATLRTSTSGGGGQRPVRGVFGGATETLVIEDDARVIAQFITYLTVTMSGNSQLVLNGGQNPLGTSSIELARDWNGSIVFNNEVPAHVVSEHLDSITVGGKSLRVGSNVQLVAIGSGTILTVTVPEPSTFVLAGFALLGVGTMLRRRAK